MNIELVNKYVTESIWGNWITNWIRLILVLNININFEVIVILLRQNNPELNFVTYR